MFGMLDYRAHKLYLTLIFPIRLPLLFMGWFAPAIAAYLLAQNISKDALFFPLIVIVGFFISEFLFLSLSKLVLAIFDCVFNFLIDAVPCNGRSREEALMVVKGGDKAIVLLKLAKDPSELTDDDIEDISKIDIWHRFFQYEIQDRLNEIKRYYSENVQIKPSQQQTGNFLKKMKLRPKWNERLVTSPIFRYYIVQFVIITMIILYAPR